MHIFPPCTLHLWLKNIVFWTFLFALVTLYIICLYFYHVVCSFDMWMFILDIVIGSTFSSVIDLNLFNLDQGRGEGG